MNGVALIDTVTTISLAAVSSGNWFKVELTRTGTTPVFTASDISGETDPISIPTELDDGFDPEKGGFYINSNARCVGIGFKDSGGNLAGIINVYSNIHAYGGYTIAHGPTVYFKNIFGELRTKTTIESGWVNTADWTNRHLGTVNVPYDNLAGAFVLGETITEAVSGNTGVVMDDDGSTLVLIEVTGGGVFTDNRQLTGGTSGATCDVDTNPNPNTKDDDSNICHNFGINLRDITLKFVVSTDGTENNSFQLMDMQYDNAVPSNNDYGFTFYQVDTNNVKIQTGSSGMVYVVDAGGGPNSLTNQNYYYNVIIEIELVEQR